MSSNCFWCQNLGKQTFAWKEGIKRSLCTSFQTGQSFLEVQLLFWKIWIPCPVLLECLLTDWQWVKFPLLVDETKWEFWSTFVLHVCKYDHVKHRGLKLDGLLFMKENLKLFLFLALPPLAAFGNSIVLEFHHKPGLNSSVYQNLTCEDFESGLLNSINGSSCWLPVC